MESTYDVVIVGGGPAGSAAAIQLARNAPDRADRVLLLDAARFPRPKLCGGGIVRESDRFLDHLDIDAPVPSVPMDTIRFDFKGGSKSVVHPRLFRVVRRDDFDHALLRKAVEVGVTVREGVPVTAVSRERDAVRVETASGDVRARMMIGADGAQGLVRRKLVGRSCGERFVALEILTPPRPGEAFGTAVFDFAPAARGLRGYAWHFPSRCAGERIWNRGLGGSRWPAGVSLKALFEEALAPLGIDLEAHRLEGWSAPLYHPESPQSSDRVVLAGDAVGVDPWLGEGISVALGTGIVAAHAASEALAADEFGFEDYAERVRESAVGWQLCRKREIAEPFYEAAAKPRGLAPWLGEEAVT